MENQLDQFDLVDQDMKKPALPEEKSTKKINFSSTQQAVIDSRNKNLLVSASAGAGKTAVLVERLCRFVIDDRVPIQSILAMTFTEDAAREMKVRLKQRLLEMDRDPWIDQQISQLETASISTIHSFCLDVVQKEYYLAGLSYSMATHVDNGLADQQALEIACRKGMERLDPLKRANMEFYLETYSKTEKDLQEILLKFLEIARSKADWKAWIQENAKPKAVVTKEFLDWFAIRIQALIDIFKEVEEQVAEMEFKQAKKQEEFLAIFSGKITKLRGCLEALNQNNYLVFYHRFIEYIETSGKFTPTINKVSFKEVQADSRKFEKKIAEVLYTIEDFEKIAQDTAELLATFCELAIDVQEEFMAQKKEAGFIDFSDMEQYAWKILQHEEAANALRDRYQVILIDEYQDTNDLQEAIIQAIARENNVFRVGDIKQSIYRFRQARPELMKHHLEHVGKHDEVIAMQENYRSSAMLISFVNRFFEQLMNIEGMPSQFGAIDVAKPGSSGQYESVQHPIRFLFTEYDAPSEDQEEAEQEKPAKSKKAIHRVHRYDLIAHDIEQKVANKEYTYRDIAILTRSSTPHEELKQALDSWGIRSIHHMRKGFYTNKAIQIILSAMRVIQDPRNDIALMAALCSPLTGLDQNDLLPLLQNRQEGQSLYQTLHNQPQGYQMLKLVRDIQKYRNLPLAEIVIRLYAYNQFYDTKTTAQDQTNLDLLLQKAVEAQSLLDLDGFLDSANLEEKLDKTSEAMSFGKEEDAVRISTIHASKGLQYKLVYILSDQNTRDMEAGMPIHIDADLGVSLEGLDLHRHLKLKSASSLAFEQKRFMEDIQEKMRLLYVACTRAEQELVFVDSLKQENLYDGPLNQYAIAANKGFTSWFFHAFHTHPCQEVVFEKVEELYTRPDRSVLSKQQRIRISHYEYPTHIIRSQTASASKKRSSWKQVQTLAQPGSLEARNRGTLIHEIVGSIPYPYQQEEIESYLKKANQTLDQQGKNQIMQLNQEAHYQKWMNYPHEFECPYCTKEEEAYVHGFMDLVVFLENEIVIVDFKSDNAFDATSLVRKYRSQLETYRKAMEQIRPGMKITAWIYSFTLGEMIEIS
ncbi:UvrD-helicase domain-containing protein [Allobaculum stercoricanis]|uniref:UvrD-helicase domain-containing protein n=1 Tax=Allobaculum stercoricanis TaxID=174709 RepID=UPI00248EC9E6|nr:UvrD-helicase domain-containing protein [Allobaculum stercoricanis]